MKEIADVLVGLSDVVDGWIGGVDTAVQCAFVLLVAEQHGVGMATITASASCLLEISLEGVGNIVVNHDSHIGFVDAHAEGVGRHHDAAVAFGPVGLA